MRVAEVDSNCKPLKVPLVRGSGRFESLILSRHSRSTCEFTKEEINDDDDDDEHRWTPPLRLSASARPHLVAETLHISVLDTLRGVHFGLNASS